MKKRLVLSKRDMIVFNALHLHGVLNMRQLSKLCFVGISSETARKRLRKLHQAGYIGTVTDNNKQDKGRPEHLYFLTALAAAELARSRNISEQMVIFGPPNANHKDHLARVVGLHFAWQRTAMQEKIVDFDFFTKRVAAAAKNGNERLNNAIAHADATIVYRGNAKETQTVSLVLETGNLRQARHWQPKINALLKTDMLILVVALNEQRLSTLRNWTLPLLKAAGVPEDRCLFGLYDEIVMRGFLYSKICCTKGSATKVPIYA